LARQKYALPSSAGHRSAPLNSPNIEELPKPATSVPVDLEALARGYARQSDTMTQAQGLATVPGLFIFVSLSMPRATLQRLVDQAARAKAAIVIRGFANGSLRTTVAQVQGLIGKQQVAIQIDPLAFDRFAITKVPSFVLVRDGKRPVACASGSCAPADSFLRSTGDVSLDYALEHMQRSAPAFSPAAELFLKRIKG
jgi:conjugal transfer pilus assembly protein TrbC